MSTRSKREFEPKQKSPVKKTKVEPGETMSGKPSTFVIPPSKRSGSKKGKQEPEIEVVPPKNNRDRADFIRDESVTYDATRPGRKAVNSNMGNAISNKLNEIIRRKDELGSDDEKYLNYMRKLNEEVNKYGLERVMDNRENLMREIEKSKGEKPILYYLMEIDNANQIDYKEILTDTFVPFDATIQLSATQAYSKNLQTYAEKKAEKSKLDQKLLVRAQQVLAEEEEKVAALTNQLQEKEGQLVKLQARLGVSQASRDELNKQITELVNNKEILDNDVKKLENNNKTLQLKLKERESALSEVDEKFKEQENNTQKKITELTKQIEQLNEARAALIKEANTRINFSKQKLGDAEESYKKNLSAVKEEYDQKIGELNVENENLKLSISSNQGDNSKLLEALKSVGEERVLLQQQYDAYVLDTNNKIENELAPEIVNLKEEAGNYKKEIDKLNNIETQLRNNIDQLVRDNQLREEEYKTSKSTLEAQITELNRQRDITTTQIEEYVRIIEQLNKELKQKEKEFNSLKEKYDISVKNIEDLNNQILDDVDTISKLQRTIGEKEKELEELQEIRREQASTIEEREAQLGEMQQTREQSRDILLELAQEDNPDEIVIETVLERLADNLGLDDEQIQNITKLVGNKTTRVINNFGNINNDGQLKKLMIDATKESLDVLNKKKSVLKLKKKGEEDLFKKRTDQLYRELESERNRLTQTRFQESSRVQPSIIPSFQSRQFDLPQLQKTEPIKMRSIPQIEGDEEDEDEKELIEDEGEAEDMDDVPYQLRIHVKEYDHTPFTYLKLTEKSGNIARITTQYPSTVTSSQMKELEREEMEDAVKLLIDSVVTFPFIYTYFLIGKDSRYDIDIGEVDTDGIYRMNIELPDLAEQYFENKLIDEDDYNTIIHIYKMKNPTFDHYDDVDRIFKSRLEVKFEVEDYDRGFVQIHGVTFNLADKVKEQGYIKMININKEFQTEKFYFFVCKKNPDNMYDDLIGFNNEDGDDQVKLSLLDAAKSEIDYYKVIRRMYALSHLYGDKNKRRLQSFVTGTLNKKFKVLDLLQNIVELKEKDIKFKMPSLKKHIGKIVSVKNIDKVYDEIFDELNKESLKTLKKAKLVPLPADYTVLRNF